MKGWQKRLLGAALLLSLSLGLGGCVGCGSNLPATGMRLERSSGDALQQQAAPRKEPAPSYPQTAPQPAGQTVVKMILESGVYKIPVRINGAEMDFIFDTGASLISISRLEASYLMKQGKISPDDVVGTAQFQDAQGNISEGTVLNIRDVQIGDRMVHDVQASIVDNTEAPLLLGQTFLRKFGKIAIDYEAGTITFY